MPNPPNIDAIKKQIEIEFRAYVNAISVLGTLRDYFQEHSFICYVEKRIEKKAGNYKTPDLLLRSNNFLFIDHKYTESGDDKNLDDKIEKMKEYNTIFVFKDPDTSVPVEFQPECVMLTPRDIIKYLKKKANCPVTWGYKLDGTVAIEQSIGKVKDLRVDSLFSPTLLAPISDEARKYKFILSHAPKSYTTVQVYAILWTMHSAKDFLKPTFQVKYSEILKYFNQSFSPWISPEAMQLNASRLKEALRFLHSLRWIKLLDSDSGKIIEVIRKRGRSMGDVIPYLINEQAKEEYAKQLKKYVKQSETKVSKEKPEFKQERLTDYF